jgi:hypothetical protein
MTDVNLSMLVSTCSRVPLVRSKLRSITQCVAIKAHVILRSFVVLTWMQDTLELV